MILSKNPLLKNSPVSIEHVNKQYAYFPVLDHGFVSLVDYMGNDNSIVQAARVSYGEGTKTKSSDEGLINYLMRHRHTTPFEMVEFKFHVGMPIFIARQWIRHRTASVNEYSGRYSIMPMLFYTPSDGGVRQQSEKNRQGSKGGVDGEKLGCYNAGRQATRQAAMEHYKELCDGNVARELARIDLPLSTYTYWYWKMDLHNLFHFLSLRCDEHAQWEIREYANTIAAIIEHIVPLAFQAWMKYRFLGKSFSYNELLLLLNLITDNNINSSLEMEQRIDKHAGGYNCSGREVDELKHKLTNFAYDDSQFVRYIEDAKAPEYFEEMIQGAT